MQEGMNCLQRNKEVWTQKDYIRCQGSLAVQGIANPILQLQQFLKEFSFLNHDYLSWNQVPIRTSRLSVTENKNKKKNRKRLAESLLKLFIINVTCEMGLEVPPCSSANKLKSTSSAVLAALLNIASVVSICLLCDDTNHPRWSGRRKPRDTSIWQSPPSNLLLIGCSRLSCASERRVPVLGLLLELLPLYALGFACLVLALPLHRCLAICTFPWWGKGGFKKTQVSYSKIPHFTMHQKWFSTGSKKRRLFFTCTSRVNPVSATNG